MYSITYLMRIILMLPTIVAYKNIIILLLLLTYHMAYMHLLCYMFNSIAILTVKIFNYWIGMALNCKKLLSKWLQPQIYSQVLKYSFCFFFEDRRVEKEASSQMLTKLSVSFIGADLKEWVHILSTLISHKKMPLIHRNADWCWMLLYKSASAFYCPKNVPMSLPHKLYNSCC